MGTGLSATGYGDKAAMHEALAGATADEAARRMHRAMAAEYRRRAADEVPAAAGADVREMALPDA